MALKDMEELIESVNDINVANFLREALACYGAGANRACVVLCHIALFDGLRAKLQKAAPVNAVARSVLAEVDKLADNQKVFELPLVQKMKGAKLLTELEAKILEQVNNQRNKAAHPSGHTVSAEEARYVFSEVITKFLALPLRETSYRVEAIISRLSEENFFPSGLVKDMDAIVEDELKDLDVLAFPYLISSLVKTLKEGKEPASDHAESFLLVLAHSSVAELSTLVPEVIKDLSSDSSHGTTVCMMVERNAALFFDASQATQIRLKALLLKNASEKGNRESITLLWNSENILTSLLSASSEEIILKMLPELVEVVVNRDTYFPAFAARLTKSPKILKMLLERYLRNAGSSDFGCANAFAKAVPAMDVRLAKRVSPEYCLQLIVKIFAAAQNGAFDSNDLREGRFGMIPHIRSKARQYVMAEPRGAEELLTRHHLGIKLESFTETYLPEDQLSGDGSQQKA